MAEGKRKELIIGSLLTLFSILFFFGLAEIGTRLFWHPKLRKKIDRFIYLKSKNKRLGYTLKPNSRYLMGNGIRVYINSLGLRDREYEIKKEFSGLRIITIGDSITFGWGVSISDTFPKVLEEKLSDNPFELPIEVINAGINGYNLTQYYELLKLLYPILKPKVAIIAICMDNDFDGARSYYFGDGFIASQRVYSLHSEGVNLKPPPFIVRKSRFLQFLLSRVRKGKPERRGERNKEATFIPEKKLYAPLDANDPIYREAKKEMQGMAKMAADRGIKLVFVLIPSLAQIYYDDLSIKPQQIIEGFAKEFDIEVLDLYPVLKAWHKRTGENPFLDYFHPKAKIHRLIADEIQTFLLRKDILSLPENKIPTTVDIGGEDGFFIVSGFSAKERGAGVNFRWGVGEESHILLYSPKEKGTLHLRCYPFLPKKGRRQKITVIVNGKYSGNITLVSKPGFRDYTLPLTPGLLRPGFNSIIFYYAYSSSPKENGLGDDPRKLSVCFDAIGIR